MLTRFWPRDAGVSLGKSLADAILEGPCLFPVLAPVMTAAFSRAYLGGHSETTSGNPRVSDFSSSRKIGICCWVQSLSWEGRLCLLLCPQEVQQVGSYCTDFLKHFPGSHSSEEETEGKRKEATHSVTQPDGDRAGVWI